MNTITAKQTAFITCSGLAVGTIAATVGAASMGMATTAATVATIAFAMLAIVGAALSIASMTAWLSLKSNRSEEYIDKFKEHAGPATAAMLQFVAQTFVQAIINAGATLLMRKLAGADRTVQHIH